MLIGYPAMMKKIKNKGGDYAERLCCQMVPTLCESC